jgi:hypothetical protein
MQASIQTEGNILPCKIGVMRAHTKGGKMGKPIPNSTNQSHSGHKSCIPSLAVVSESEKQLAFPTETGVTPRMILAFCS